MAFSKKQLPKFGAMVSAAWKAHCDRACITESTHVSKDGWYREQLRKEFGVSSSKELNPRNHFEEAMALFEEIAEAGVYWQMRALQGDKVRARHKLDQTIKELRLTEDYVTRVALQAGFRDGLKDYTAEQLMLLTHVRRKQDRYVEQTGGLALG